jgi:hypothetical protein
MTEYVGSDREAGAKEHLLPAGPFHRQALSTRRDELEAEGTDEKIAGKVQEKIGQVKKVLGK